MNTHSPIHEFLSFQQPVHMEYLTSTLVPLTYYHYHNGCEINFHTADRFIPLFHRTINE